MNPSILEGLRVVNLGNGMPAALFGKMLAEFGAKVYRPANPADIIFSDVYPAWSNWTKADQAVGAVDPEGEFDERLAEADICLLGGEDFPGACRTSGARRLAQIYPRLIAVEIAGYPPESERAGRPATDILAQAASGLSWEQFEDRPILMAYRPSLYGSTLLALIGTLAALVERQRSGKGQAVETSLLEGALFWRKPFWFEADRNPAGKWLSRPKGATPLIFECSDGRHIHISLSTAGAGEAIGRALGFVPPAPKERDAKSAAANFFGDIDWLAPLIRERRSDEVIALLRSAGLQVEPVLPPGACWDDPQTDALKLIVQDDKHFRYVGNPISFVAGPSGEPSAKSRLLCAETILAGVRIIDLGTFVAGPLATCLLAEMGAEVIKVESLQGDPTRTTFWWNHTVNRSKRNIKLDLKSEPGIKVFYDLCGTADLVANNYRTGVAARLGVDPTTLGEKFPGLCMLEAPAYGQVGPRAMEPGVDMTMQALSGHEYRAGGVGNPPLWNRTTFVDLSSGLLGACGALLGLYHRSRTGDGISACVPLLSSAIYMLSELVQAPDGTFRGAPQIDIHRSGNHPGDAMYRASDGWIAVAALDAGSMARLAGALGLPGQMGADPSSLDEGHASLIAHAIAQFTLQDLLALFADHKIWAEAVTQAGPSPAKDGVDINLFKDEEFGMVWQIGHLIRFSRSTLPRPAPSPSPGQDSRVILSELECPAELIDQLFTDGVVA